MGSSITRTAPRIGVFAALPEKASVFMNGEFRVLELTRSSLTRISHEVPVASLNKSPQ
jgi:hypothetical protein